MSCTSFSHPLRGFSPFVVPTFNERAIGHSAHACQAVYALSLVQLRLDPNHSLPHLLTERLLRFAVFAQPHPRLAQQRLQNHAIAVFRLRLSGQSTGLTAQWRGGEGCT